MRYYVFYCPVDKLYVYHVRNHDGTLGAMLGAIIENEWYSAEDIRSLNKARSGSENCHEGVPS